MAHKHLCGGNSLTFWSLQDTLSECVHLRHVHLRLHSMHDMYLARKLLQRLATMQHLRVLYWDGRLTPTTSGATSHCSFFLDDFVRQICRAASPGLQLLELHVGDGDHAAYWKLQPSLKYLGVRNM